MVEERGPVGATVSRKVWIFAIGGFLLAVVGVVSPAIYLISKLDSRGPTLQDATEIVPSFVPPDEEVVHAAGVGTIVAEPYAGLIGNKIRSAAWNPWPIRGGQVWIDAPWAEFPVSDKPYVEGDEHSCTDQQIAWLTANGIPNPEQGHLDGETLGLVSEDLLNTAESGGAISVRNIRVEGEFLPDTRPRVSFWCFAGGVGGIEVPIYARAVIGDSTPAWFIENTDTFDSPTPLDLIGTPVTINLAPGESTSFYLFLDTIDRSKDFKGRVVADVIAGDQTYLHVVDEGYLQLADSKINDLYLVAGFGKLYCFTDVYTMWDLNFSGWVDDYEPYSCSPQEVQALLASR